MGGIESYFFVFNCQICHWETISKLQEETKLIKSNFKENILVVGTRTDADQITVESRDSPLYSRVNYIPKAH